MGPVRHRLASAGALIGLAAAPGGLAAAPQLEWTAGLQRHTLEERSPQGGRLVQEGGAAPLLGIGLGGPLPGAASRWQWRAQAEAWASDAEYDGRTQGGTALRSRTGTASARTEAWLATPPIAPGLRLQSGLQAERFTRRIAGAAGAAGLDERTTQVRWALGVQWSGAGWQARLQSLRTPGARLSVRFEQDLFDDARLHSGPIDGWAAAVGRTLAPGWALQLRWERLRVGASDIEPLRRDGVTVGTVAQPAWRRERLGLELVRSFD